MVKNYQIITKNFKVLPLYKNPNLDWCLRDWTLVVEDKKGLKIDEIPKLTPAMISFNKPNKNIRILDGFKFNFLMHKKIAIEIRLGAALLKTGK